MSDFRCVCGQYELDEQNTTHGPSWRMWSEGTGHGWLWCRERGRWLDEDSRLPQDRPVDLPAGPQSPRGDHHE